MDHTDIANLLPPDEREGMRGRSEKRGTGRSISWPFGWVATRPVGQVLKVLQSRAPLASCLLIYAALQPQGNSQQRAVKVYQLAWNKKKWLIRVKPVLMIPFSEIYPLHMTLCAQGFLHFHFFLKDLLVKFTMRFTNEYENII